MTDFSSLSSSLLPVHYCSLLAVLTVTRFSGSPPLVSLYPKITCYHVRCEPMNTMFKIQMCEKKKYPGVSILYYKCKHSVLTYKPLGSFSWSSVHDVDLCQFSALSQLISIVTFFILLHFYLRVWLKVHLYYSKLGDLLSQIIMKGRNWWIDSHASHLQQNYSDTSHMAFRISQIG